VAIAREAAAHHVFLFGYSAFPLWYYVVKGSILAQRLGAVSTAVVPFVQNTVTEADLCFFPWDEFGLVYLVIHYHLAPNSIKNLDLRLYLFYLII